jgi:hypothetical protein
MPSPFTDCFHPEIAAMFIPVPTGVSPEQGWTYDGTRFAAPVPPVIPPPTLSEQAASLLFGSVAMQCTSLPALDAAYAIDTGAQMQAPGVTLFAAAAGTRRPRPAMMAVDIRLGRRSLPDHRENRTTSSCNVFWLPFNASA